MGPLLSLFSSPPLEPLEMLKSVKKKEVYKLPDDFENVVKN